jgi:hypothetical protein
VNDVDRYLDRLLAELRGSAADVRRVLAEVEEHLRDAVHAGIAEGLPEDEAERRAVERFGSPRIVARRFGATLPPREVARTLASVLVPFAAIGLMAVGVSGVISEVFGRLFGPAFVAGDPPWVRYTPQRCAEVQRLYPGHGCLDAVVLDHWDEVVVFRVAAGALGVLLFGGFALVRRRTRPATVAPWPGMVPVTGVALYGLAAAVLLLQGLDAGLLGGVHGGSGQWWSAGIVALAVALAYARSAVRVSFEKSTM